MTTTRSAESPMSLWRLEWLRLTRTRRLVALIAVYAFFGLTSPPLARYMNEILERVGSGVQIVAPPAGAAQGLATYVSNTNQLGLLVYVLIVSSAVAFDSQREMAVFLRTRVARYRVLLVPKYLVPVAAGAAAFTLGTAATWFGTVVLLGDVDSLAVLSATALEILYLAFIGAVAAALGARLNSVLTTAAGTIAVALTLGIIGTIGSLGDWLPSHLLSALTFLPLGGEAHTFIPSALLTGAATAALLILAARLGDRREI
jgi:ABC-2 type transport system permease protein